MVFVNNFLGKVFDIALKTLRENVRQPRTLAISLGLPVVFMVIFGLAFGGTDDPETFSLAVANADQGTMGATYVAGLGNLTYGDGTPLLSLTLLPDAAAARGGLEDRSFDALLFLPEDFSSRASPTARPIATGPLGLQQGNERVPADGARITLTGDPSFMDYAAVARIVAAYTEQFNAAVSGEAPVVTVAEEDVASNDLTAFDRIAPGLMVFAILNLMPAAAATLARETERGTIDRFRQSPSRALHLLGGVTLAHVVLAMVSLGFMFVAAALMGFNNQGSYVSAYLIAMGASVAVVGLGMIVAALVKTEQEAANMGALVSVPMSFLSGSFFALPAVTLFTWQGRTIELYDAIPTTHAVDAMRQVLTYGNGLASVLFSLAAMGVLGVVAFTFGVAIYRRTRLAPS